MVKLALVFLIASALELGSGMKIGFRSEERLAQENIIYSSRITGGQNAKEGEFPYQISLHYNRNHLCGGVIISENVVLTAAHCVRNRNIGQFEVVAGFINMRQMGSNVQRSALQKIASHPGYGGSVGPNDIAVLVLKTPLKMTTYVQKALLPTAGQEVTGNTILSGWGSTSTTSKPTYPSILQKATLPIVSYEDCRKYYANSGSSVDKASNICTGPIGGGLSACSGDSGGPLVKEIQGKKYVVGLVSWGSIPCGNGSPSVYAKVSNFIDFINKNSK